MNIPLLKSCDIQKRDNQKNNFAVHNLSELVKEDLYIPKIPHKHSFFQILYVSRGAGIHYVDFQEWEIEDGTIFFLSPGQVHDLRFTSKNPEGIMINFNEDFFNDFLSQKDFINSLSVFSKSGKYGFRKVDSCKSELESTIAKILKVIKYDSLYKKQFIQTLVLEIVLMIAMKTKDENPENEIISNNYLLVKFEKLLEKYFMEAHHPKFYAAHLSVTPNYLNTVCKKLTGKTAGEIIRNRIVLEAKRFLVNSEYTISQIAYELYFEDNSYFTKFFKANTGISPAEFRKSINK
ncbi:AraC family transcriptional regulator [Elizabethkingia miricola]|uniref:AraC family transcriptional regulator n=1 Tax=Elizabethkingia miricola TaxID=172045 RepID=UPI00293CACC7|nr:AraC family transcriptional regulator [Elizabethkingia miricola]MDV3462904.1 AraC family transcriptional regulator [Elizabethkingia anophelis]WQM38077.1 AraC family transcriptional regulator [Elizabethkingia miricola]